MNIALISTVFNEEATIRRWIAAVKAQTIQPSEFVIVDGGSTDQTVFLLQEGFDGTDFPKPKIIIQRCNIAEGRNLAIRNTTADIIASVDAGSVPDSKWLEEITRPFLHDSTIGVVGGWCPCVAENHFQQRLERYCSTEKEKIPTGSGFNPSSRNVAFTRQAWETVGGYPEWLTLTAEDALFNVNMHRAGIRFVFQPSALVSWEARPCLSKYLKMMWNYGYGSGETGQATRLYLKWLATTLFPPLILISRHPVSDVPLRYLRNAATACGWLAGKLTGRKPPYGWKRIDGDWLSPQTIAAITKSNILTRSHLDAKNSP